MGNPSRRSAVASRARESNVWRECLVTDPDRLRWIFETYPEERESGRAILYMPESPGKSGARRKPRKDPSRYGIPVQNTDAEEMDAAA